MEYLIKRLVLWGILYKKHHPSNVLLVSQMMLWSKTKYKNYIFMLKKKVASIINLQQDNVSMIHLSNFI